MRPDTILLRLEMVNRRPAELWEHGGSWIIYQPEFVSSTFEDLDRAIGWQQDSMRIFGRSVPLPRLTAWYGDAGTGYSYSGIVNVPKPWNEELLSLRHRLRDGLGFDFNAVLANRYADGAQHQGYHADDEVEFGEEPLIASLSFGATRRFLVRSKARGLHETLRYDLETGSLLLMGGRLQDDYAHAISKTKAAIGPRINLTFRRIGA